MIVFDEQGDNLGGKKSAETLVVNTCIKNIPLICFRYCLFGPKGRFDCRLSSITDWDPEQYPNFWGSFCWRNIPWLIEPGI